MRIKKYGAIDIGSNAIRLLVSRVIEKEGRSPQFKKVSLIRLPIRLGQEAFSNKTISPETSTRFIEGMKAIQSLLIVHQVEAYDACATSAMREAENGPELVSQAREETGIDIKIISGKEEAKIIFDAHFKQNIDPDSNYIYVDVGGGSTELTILSEGKITHSKSFKIGTIRLLNEMVTKEKWNEMKRWVKANTKSLDHVNMIGSGGNINKIYKLLNKDYPSPMFYHELKIMRQSIKRLDYESLISDMNLNPDRADVIGHASDIYYNIMKWSDASILHVPKFGLSDGIVMRLHDEENS